MGLLEEKTAIITGGGTGVESSPPKNIAGLGDGGRFQKDTGECDLPCGD